MRSISLAIWREGEPAPRLLRQLELSDVDAGARRRDQLQRGLAAAGGNVRALRPSTDYARVDVRLSGGSGDAEAAERWLIVQSIGGGRALAMCDEPLVLAHGLQPLPWAGVAARLAPSGGVEGQPFCLLPLPSFTGLPVHVNGFFEVSTNRRDIWWGADVAGAGRVRSDWNEALLVDVVAPAYAQLLLSAREHMPPSRADFYALWPQRPLPEPWGGLVRAVYALALDAPLLRCEAGGGRG